ncbi:hypothetical protein B5E92_04905 [Erysipelatoclostridium sp. An15]|uniref:hypothetical protein n=1 Tax=uncultured Thomasclavelia sp. TaxID=3025759 RepID=UPI000B38AC7F|nr:hypothetical protein [uncultured Thomasclavelia sp.]OUQ08216.1 hypothetical protein B5E92_04905 [Erysipelatoclostridium sp. An15]
MPKIVIYKKLIDYYDNGIDSIIFTILYFTGLYNGKLLALILTNINFDNLIINIDKPYQKNIIVMEKS